MSSLDPLQWRSDASKYILQSRQQTQDSLKINSVNSLPTLFKWQAQQRSSTTLFSFRSQPGTSLTKVSYGHALETTTRLASALHKFFPATTRETPTVAIWFERSIELHLSVLATTISGVAWLPFDPAVPAERVKACISDSEAFVLLCDATHHKEALQATQDMPGCRVVTFDELTRLSQEESDVVAQSIPDPDPQETAYLIYTSGSTGMPKGIKISHHAAVTFSLSEQSILETGPEDVVWQGFSPAFDMWIEEV
jgi:non-ribosomal peptide synthetase component F